MIGELPGSRVLDFHVFGAPAPQGSKKAFVIPGTQRAVVTESSKQVKPWRAAVAAAVSAAMHHPDGSHALPFDGPLALHLRFVLPAPTSLSRKKLALGPCKKPDLDKLVRSTMDGITEGGAWADDARVVELGATKRYAAPGEATGVWGRLWVQSSA